MPARLGDTAVFHWQYTAVQMDGSGQATAPTTRPSKRYRGAIHCIDDTAVFHRQYTALQMKGPGLLITTGVNVEFEQLSIPDVVLLKPKVHGDDRGFFMEMFRQQDFEKTCGVYQFVQTNFSRSAQGILRGLHYQLNRPQGKLVSVTRGEVFDVCVDLRRSSATYGKWLGVYLSEHNKHSLWIPPGFAHGFYVTSELADFQYQCTDYYDPADEHCLVWNDAELAITWPLSESSPNCSAKDVKGLSLANCPKFD